MSLFFPINPKNKPRAVGTGLIIPNPLIKTALQKLCLFSILKNTSTFSPQTTILKEKH